MIFYTDAEKHDMPDVLISLVGKYEDVSNLSTQLIHQHGATGNGVY